MNNFNNSFKVFLSCIFVLLHISVASSAAQSRIVGGVPTTIADAPFLIQIFKSEIFHCGGTLISPYFIVTAAHCIHNVPPRSITLVGGVSYLSDVGVTSKVDKMMIPTDYNLKTLNMDVAVIKAKTPLIGPSIRPIGLCNGDWNTGDPVQIYGWGKQAEDASNIPIQLQTATVNVISRYTCAKMYLHRMNITSSVFCAAASGKDACSGDSGGPALVNGKFCGIVSWGVGCGRSDSPGVYSDVKKVSNFITNAMQQ